MSIILQIWENFYVISLRSFGEEKTKHEKGSDIKIHGPQPFFPGPQKVTANLNLTCKSI